MTELQTHPPKIPLIYFFNLPLELPEGSTVTRPSPTPPTLTLHSWITCHLSWRDGRDPSQWLSMLPAQIFTTRLMLFSTSGIFIICNESNNFKMCRDCSQTNLVRDFATFHIYFDLDHIPDRVPQHESLLEKVQVKSDLLLLTVHCSETKL